MWISTISLPLVSENMSTSDIHGAPNGTWGKKEEETYLVSTRYVSFFLFSPHIPLGALYFPVCYSICMSVDWANSKLSKQGGWSEDRLLPW